MPRTFFKKLLPDPAKIRENRYLAVLGTKMHNSDCWHLTRRSVAGAFFIGVFCAFLPIPLQTLLAAFLAIIFKRNLPLSVVLVFITNPITMTPIYYFNYWLGSILLNEPSFYQTLNIDDIWVWLAVNFNHIGKPLIVGSIVAGLIFGLLSFVAIHLFWQWSVRTRWKKRQLRRSQN
ncbi:MAG: DUF2062 domain-containing protein [Pseudomonadales bacterium]|jgi:hypothetical protein